MYLNWNVDLKFSFIQDSERTYFNLARNVKAALARARIDGIKFVVGGYYKKIVRPDDETSQITKINISFVKPVRKLKSDLYEGELPEAANPAVLLNVNREAEVTYGRVPDVSSTFKCLL